MNTGIELFKSNGALRYFRGESGGYKLILEADPQIAYYYKSLIPKYIRLNPQKYNPHISIVRKEFPTNIDKWGLYEGKTIDFYYSNYIHNGEVYWWLNVWSFDMEKIREELGLSIEEKYTKAPQGFIKTFHMTLGNQKAI